MYLQLRKSKFPEVTKDGEHHFTYYTVSLIQVYDMPPLHFTHQQERFHHLSDGGTGKNLRHILSMLNRYCSLYHCQLNFISCTVSNRVINTVCCPLMSKQLKLFCSFLKEPRNKKMGGPDVRTELGLYIDKTIHYII